MFKLLLVCLAVTSAVAQSCIPNAVPGPNGKCVCAQGMTGNGDLCCHSPIDYKSCYVAGDPILTSYFGRKIGMDFPCGTLVSSTFNSGASCHVDVYSSSRAMRSGVFYTAKAIIKLIGKPSGNAVIDLDFDNDPPQYVVEENSNIVYFGPFSNSGDQTYSLVGSEVSVSFDSANQLITVSACDTIINVRPARGDDPNEGKTPGLCVMAKPGASFPSSMQVCGLSQDVSDTTSFLMEAIKPANNYIFPTPVLSSATSSQFAGFCNHYRTIMGTKCMFIDRENALKKCAFILFHPLVRKCFYESGSGDVQGRVWSSYTQCLETYCTGDRTLCTNLQSDRQIDLCGSSLQNCQTWPPYRRVNRFVAGEGEQVNFGENGNQVAETTSFNPLAGGGILGEGGDNGGAGGAGGEENGFNPGDFL